MGRLGSSHGTGVVRRDPWFNARVAAHPLRGLSDYLVQRIERSPKFTLHPTCEITALAGEERLREVTWTDRSTGLSEARRVGNVFLMIGAEPNTEWLEGCLALDDKRFVRTGSSADGAALASPHATTRPGLLAVGDVRSGSVKRCRLRRRRRLRGDPGGAPLPQP